MKWLDKVLAQIAPRLALRSLQARISIKNYYEGAESNRFRTLTARASSPDENNRPDIATLREQARKLDDNYDVAGCALDTFVNNIVGTGIVPDPMVKNLDGKPASEFNDELRRLHKDWIKNPEVTKEYDYYSMQRLLCRSFGRDGEVFMQYLEGSVPGLNHQTVVPFSVEPLEADYVPHDLDDTAKRITQGIQKNAWGEPINYFVYKEHPGDRMAAVISSDTKPVSKDKMMHMKACKRIRQTRGITKFANVMNRFDDIKEIEESERVAARVAAAMAGVIKKGSPELFIPLTQDETDEKYRHLEFAPGMIFDDLRPGEDVGTIGSNRPNNSIIEFVDSNMRRAAGGIGINYSSLSKNFNGSYSAQRQELSEAFVNYGVLWHFYKEKEARPTWERFVKMALSSGAIAPGTEVDPETLFDADFSRPVIPWVDPQKEMTAIEKELALNLNSKSAVMQSRGRNPDDVRRKIAEDQEQEDMLGLANPVSEMEPESGQPSDEDEEDQENDDNQEDDTEIGGLFQGADGIYRRTETGYEKVEIVPVTETDRTKVA